MAAGEDRASFVDVRACETWNKMLELQALVGEFRQTVSGERERVIALVIAELVHFGTVMIEALLKRKGTVRDLICNVGSVFLV